MNALGRFFEGGLLLGAAAFMVRLLDSGLYYQFLNPRFQWMTLATALILGLFGVARLTQDRPARFFRSATLAGFLALAFLALSGMAPPPLPASFGQAPDPGQIKPSREKRGGREYVRLNLAELAVLGLRADRDEGARPERVVLTGLVRRNPGLDGQGRFLVSRLVITCCLADATAAGVLVRIPDGTAGPGVQGLQEGQWVRVFGRPVPRGDGEKPDLDLPGVSSSLIDEHSEVEAEVLEPMRDPELPYIFDIRDREPFAG